MIATLGLAATLLATTANASGDSGRAAGAAAVYVLAVGNNSTPEGAAELTPLRFADDDALRFFAFADRLARRGILLASVDKDTRARQPDFAALARDPTGENLRLAIAELRQQIVVDRARYPESHVFVFFSGHGVRDDDGRASLALADGKLTQEQLYEQVLGNLPATYVHLLVDACHAESFVQPRSAHAATVPLDQADTSAFLIKHTLGRFPNVGAIVAGTSRAETHEWDLYQGGVFTHQLLSGLRGAGDVNGDGRVEYSEIFAFLTAANAAVSEPAARLSVSVRAPASKPTIPIVRLADLRQHGTLVLTGSGRPRPTYVEDDRGERLADFNPESRFRVSLALPADRQLFLRDSEGELVFRLGPGQTLTLSQAELRPRVERARGAIAVTFRRGLFQVPFGWGFYQGLMSQRLDLTPIVLSERLSPPPIVQAKPSRLPAWLSFGGAAVLGAASATTGILSLAAREDFQQTPFQRPAAEAYSKHRRFQTMSVVTGVAAATAAALGVVLWPSPSAGDGPVEGQAQVALGSWEF